MKAIFKPQLGSFLNIFSRLLLCFYVLCPRLEPLNLILNKVFSLNKMIMCVMTISNIIDTNL